MSAGDRPPPDPTSRKKTGSHTQLRSLGRYIIEKKVGAGGMGAVYRARDEQLKRIVALKVLPRDKAQNPILVKRFQSEAQAAAHLRHPNIIGVYDAGEIDGYLYIAMEFVEGIDVGDLVSRKGALSARRSLDIVRQVTLALQHAYEQNIVHRDIKPSNLMINREGTVKLADMGLARSLNEEESSSITRDGTTVGTVDYMSPEQARDSKAADCRSDLYSLGATWFQMLCGQPPFPDGDLLNKITAHAKQPPPDPRDINPDVPDALADIILKMLEKRPEDRYQTPQELLDDLDSANLEQREISIDLLAALGDDAPAEKALRHRAGSATPRLGDDVPSIDLLAGLSEEDSEPASPDPPRNRPARKKSAQANRTGRQKPSRKSRVSPEKSAPSAETVADRSSTDSVPSARDVMLRRGGRRRQGGRGVSIDPVRMIVLVVTVMGLFFAYSFVRSMLTAENEQPAAAASPANSPPESPAAPDHSLSVPGNPSAPSSPPRRR